MLVVLPKSIICLNARSHECDTFSQHRQRRRGIPLPQVVLAIECVAMAVCGLHWFGGALFAHQWILEAHLTMIGALTGTSLCSSGLSGLLFYDMKTITRGSGNMFSRHKKGVAIFVFCCVSFDLYLIIPFILFINYIELLLGVFAAVCQFFVGTFLCGIASSSSRWKCTR